MSGSNLRHGSVSSLAFVQGFDFLVLASGLSGASLLCLSKRVPRNGLHMCIRIQRPLTCQDGGT